MISPEVLGVPQKLDPFTNDGKAAWTKAFQDLTAAIDAAGICLFTSLAPVGAPEFAAMISSVTGMQVDEHELMLIGERIWTVQNLFNMKEGYAKSDDTLPARLLTEPLKEGEPAGRLWQRTSARRVLCCTGLGYAGGSVPVNLRGLGLG